MTARAPVVVPPLGIGVDPGSHETAIAVVELRPGQSPLVRWWGAAWDVGTGERRRWRWLTSDVGANGQHLSGEVESMPKAARRLALFELEMTGYVDRGAEPRRLAVEGLFANPKRANGLITLAEAAGVWLGLLGDASRPTASEWRPRVGIPANLAAGRAEAAATRLALHSTSWDCERPSTDMVPGRVVGAVCEAVLIATWVPNQRGGSK